MRKLVGIIVAATGLLPMAASIAADDAVGTIPVDSRDDKKDDDARRDADERESVTYSGIGLARLSSDFDNLKDAVNLNFALGFRVPTIDWIGAELELSTTVIPGQNRNTSGGSSGGNCGGILQPPCPGTTQSNDDLQTNSIGVYGVLRSPGRFYGMAKYGYRYLATSISDFDEDRSGSTWGLGAGYRWGRSLSGVELYYTKLSDQLEFMGFSLSYGFGGHRDRD